MVKWSEICGPKNQGGLGVLDLEIMNKALLGKWLWKLENEEGIWQEYLRNKYLKGKILRQKEVRVGDSQFWHGMMKVKNEFFECCYKKIGNGKKIPCSGRILG